MHHRDPFIDELLSLEPLKTWSLIVTIFGDFDGDVLTGAQLRALLEPLGIKPDAIRVALHRLKTDGWITSRKAGREARYSLSAHGRRETEAARADIYGSAEKYPDGWSLVLIRDTSEGEIGILLGRDAALVPTNAAKTMHNAFAVRLDENCIPPTWMQNILAPPDQLGLAQGLAQILAKAREDLAEMPPSDLSALRLLTLHHWRRLALRSGSWAHMSLLKDGAIGQCREAVIELLDRSARTSI